jgi:hypothetical protein
VCLSGKFFDHVKECVCDTTTVEVNPRSGEIEFYMTFPVGM